MLRDKNMGEMDENKNMYSRLHVPITRASTPCRTPLQCEKMRTTSSSELRDTHEAHVELTLFCASRDDLGIFVSMCHRLGDASRDFPTNSIAAGLSVSGVCSIVVGA